MGLVFVVSPTRQPIASTAKQPQNRIININTSPTTHDIHCLTRQPHQVLCACSATTRAPCSPTTSRACSINHITGLQCLVSSDVLACASCGLALSRTSFSGRCVHRVASRFLPQPQSYLQQQQQQHVAVPADKSVPCRGAVAHACPSTAVSCTWLAQVGWFTSDKFVTGAECRSPHIAPLQRSRHQASITLP